MCLKFHSELTRPPITKRHHSFGRLAIRKREPKTGFATPDEAVLEGLMGSLSFIYGPVKVSTGLRRHSYAGKQPPYGAKQKVNDNTRYEAPVAA